MVLFMTKNKANLNQIMKIMKIIVFVIFAISCLTLLDSATATVIDLNQESDNENIGSVDEYSVEPVLTFFTFQNKASENESVQRNILSSNNESSQSDNKTDDEDSNKNIENTNQCQNMKITSFNTAKAAENTTNDNSDSQSSVAIDNNVIEPNTKNHGMKTQYTGILVSVIFLMISLSSFILYLKS